MRHGWLLVVGVMAGCVQSASVVCGDGTVCPEGATCDIALGRCITGAQTAACEALAEGDPCTIVGAPGECRGGACEPLVCGDGRATGAEACDGDDLGGATCASLGFSSTTTGLACNDLCRFDTAGCAGICGDGVRDGSELCDGANPDGVTCQDRGFYDPGPGPLTCNGLCGWDTTGCTGSCGDGIVNGPELCDGAPPRETCVAFGFDAGTSGCSTACGAAFDRCARFGFGSSPITTTPVYAFHASSVDAQWVVGEGGFAARVRPDGTWQPTATGTTAGLSAVSSVSPVRAWAAGGTSEVGSAAVVLRWDGTAWTPIPAAPSVVPLNIVGFADAIVIGTLDGVYAWDAQGWRALGSLPGSIGALGATSLDDVWATAGGALHRWDGTRWSPILADVVAVDVEGVDDVVALTRGATSATPTQLQRWDGQSWASSPTPMSTASYLARGAANSIWAADRTDVWHFDGIRWSPLGMAAGPGSTLEGLAAFGVDTVVSATGNGKALRFRGQGRVDLVGVSYGTVNDTWSDGAGSGVAVTINGRILPFRNFEWKAASTVSSMSLRAAWGTSGTDLWVGGLEGTVYRGDGTSWSPAVTGLGRIATITGTSPTDVWVFGENGAHHFDGVTWTPYPRAGGLDFSGGAVVNGSVWALAATGIYRLEGTSWVEAHLVPAPTSIAVLAADDVYVTYDLGLTLLHYDGVSWTEVSVPVNRGLIQVSASAPDDVFAASPTELVHFDGSTWTPVRLDASATRPLTQLRVFPQLVELVFATPSALYSGGIVRTRPWSCRATETACADGVDDDCDGVHDGLDSDCP